MKILTFLYFRKFVCSFLRVIKIYLCYQEPVTEPPTNEEIEKESPDTPEVNEEESDDETYNPDVNIENILT